MYKYANLSSESSGYRKIIRIIHSENEIAGDDYVLITGGQIVSATDLYDVSANAFIKRSDAPDLRTQDQVSLAVLCEEQSWVSSEMSISDIEINKHLDNDPRATATEAAWRAYRCQLRDYVKAGVVVGERPVRPI